MSEIERLVRIQDERWLGPHPDEPKWRRDAKDMEAWPAHVPVRRPLGDGVTMYELQGRFVQEKNRR
jgi:hypothetical protein